MNYQTDTHQSPRLIPDFIPEVKELTAADINIEDAAEGLFEFGGKYWKVNPKEIEDEFCGEGEAISDYWLGCHRQSVDKYEIGFDDIDERELKPWLFARRDKWMEEIE